MHAVSQDSAVPALPNLPQAHLASYYTKYYGKELTITKYGFERFRELAEDIKDTGVITSECAFLAPQLARSIGFDHFLQLTDTHRRDRWQRIDTGDDSALLRFR